MSYIRKNHLTINEDVEIYEIVSGDGKTVEWFGTEEQVAELIGTVKWECGDTLVWITDSTAPIGSNS